MSDQEVYKQPFIVTGRRILSRTDIEDNAMAVLNAALDLQTTLETWLWISPVVAKWRSDPETNVDKDFEHDRMIVQIRGRGWFDIDSPTPPDVMMIELPQ
jgi:hypothetical protein